MLRPFYRVWGLFSIASKRILSQPGLALATLVGMIFAISLTMSIPLYASGVYSRTFLQRVGIADTTDPSHNYPPFSFIYMYDSNQASLLSWDGIAPVDQFFEKQAASTLGLPLKQLVRFFSTDTLALFPTSQQSFNSQDNPLLWTSIATLSDYQNHVTLIEGQFPGVSGAQDTGPVEVLIHQNLAEKLGLQAGEEYHLFSRSQPTEGGSTTISIPIKIAGVYTEDNPKSEFWSIAPSLLQDRLLVPEGTFTQRINSSIKNEIYLALWGLLPDSSGVNYDQATPLMYRILTLNNHSTALLPNIQQVVSPLSSLNAFVNAANLLTILLFAFSVPIFGLLLAFIVMISSVMVERQRNEIAVLRSRGALMVQMTGISAVEGLILGGLAFVLSLPVSALIAWLIERTRSFLDFNLDLTQSMPRLDWTSTSLLAGAAVLLLALAARLIPTIQAARTTIVHYKQERSRVLRAPFWQRAWLDVILMVPAGYGLYLLQKQGSLSVIQSEGQGDPFQNPLLFLVPVLAILALTLFFLRLAPWMMRLVSWIAARTNAVGLLMAARHLARSPATYTLPLVLLVLTLSLSAFTATLAGTLDGHLHDQLYYEYGSEVSFFDAGEQPASSAPGSPLAGATDPSNTANSQSAGIVLGAGQSYFFPPVTDYLQVPGIKSVARVGKYAATVVVAGKQTSAQLLGVDRATLPDVMYWRQDFASVPLVGLMNDLGMMADGLLVPQSFMSQNALQPGDFIQLNISGFGQAHDLAFRVAGNFHYFPTYYPSEAILFVGNLDYIFDTLGGEIPHNVWLKTDGISDVTQMEDTTASTINPHTILWDSVPPRVATELVRPERQGLFGVLSVGFTAAALLTVLGFLIYALFSFQRRFVELGMLRAIGLSSYQMTSLLGFELAFLIILGGLVGTILGVWISDQFIPFLQIGSDPASKVPPYLVEIAWPAVDRIYILFGLLFVIALVLLVGWLRQMKAFQAIKLGETA